MTLMAGFLAEHDDCEPGIAVSALPSLLLSIVLNLSPLFCHVSSPSYKTLRPEHSHQGFHAAIAYARGPVAKIYGVKLNRSLLKPVVKHWAKKCFLIQVICPARKIAKRVRRVMRGGLHSLIVPERFRMRG